MKRLPVIRMMVLLAAVTGLAFGQAEKLLEAARQKEVMDGDLKAAIEQYRKIAAQFAKQPEVAAKALLQMGQCQEKLGQAEARKSYERVVKEYAGASQYASAARARLVALGGEGNAAPRVVWENSSSQVWCTSADGRWISFPDRDTKNLLLRDLVTGEQRQLTKQSAPSTLGAEGSIVSADGSRVAYLWVDRDKPVGQGHTLRVIQADGNGERVLATLQSKLWIQPLNWSPDGQWIVVRKGYAGGVGWRVLLISVEDGREREIVSRDGLRGAIPEFVAISPDGRWLAFSAPARNRQQGRGIYVVPTAEPATPPVEVAVGARLVGWSPKGDGVVIARKGPKDTALHLLPVAGGKVAGESVQLNSVVLGDNYPLAVTRSGSLLYFRATQDQEGLVARFGSESGQAGAALFSRPTTGDGWVLMGGGVRFSPDGKKVLITRRGGGLVIRSLVDGSESIIQPLMKLPLRYEWAADSSALLSSGEGQDGRAGLYRIDLRTGDASLIKLDEGWAVSFAVFTPTRDGKSVLVRNPEGISSVDLSTGEVRRNIIPTAMPSFIHMTFSPDGRQLAIFGDSGVHVVQMETGRFRELIRTPGTYLGGDWSPDGKFIFSTWVPGSWNSGEPAELVRLPTSGGAPDRTALGANYVGLRLSPDGKLVGMTRRSPVRHQVLAIDDLFAATGRR